VGIMMFARVFLVMGVVMLLMMAFFVVSIGMLFMVSVFVMFLVVALVVVSVVMFFVPLVPFVMLLMVGVVMFLVVPFVSGLTMRLVSPVRLAAGERRVAERHDQPNGHHRYQDAAYQSHSVPLVEDCWLEKVPILDRASFQPQCVYSR
jgi:hypothetical protein